MFTIMTLSLMTTISAQTSTTSATTHSLSPKSDPLWAVAIGVSPWGYGGSPAANALFERRLDPRNWLFARLEAQADFGDTSAVDRWLFGEIGWRHILNRGAFVEVSPFLSGGVTYRRGYGLGGFAATPNGGLGAVAAYPARDWSLDANAGVMLDKKLAEQLWLRAETTLLSANYNWNSLNDDTVARVSLKIEPRIALRFEF